MTVAKHARQTCAARAGRGSGAPIAQPLSRDMPLVVPALGASTNAPPAAAPPALAAALPAVAAAPPAVAAAPPALPPV